MRLDCAEVKTQLKRNPEMARMAKRISKLPDRASGRPPIYPWERWMDGSAWRITRGKDFDVSAASMAQIVRNRARAKGIPARAYVDGESVEFQYTREDVAAA